MMIHETVFRAEGSRIIGDVTIGEGSGVWFNTVIRGDTDKITIGKRVNVQDCSVLHVDEGFPLTIGDDVTIGHNAIIHGCTIGNNCIIGMGAIIMNGTVIGDNCVIGAGTVVTGGKNYPAGSIVYGTPAKIQKEANEKTIEANKHSAEHYAHLAEMYRKGEMK